MSSALWIRWLRIAIGHAKAARVERLMGLEAKDAGVDVAEAIANETDYALQAVAAAAFALDGFHSPVRDLIPPETKRRWRENRTARHRQIAETLKVGFSIGAYAQRLPADLEWLFDLRDPAVHHDEKMHEPEPHPLGPDVSVESRNYCWENAKRAVDLAVEVVTSSIASAKPATKQIADRFSPTVTELAQEWAETSESEV